MTSRISLGGDTDSSYSSFVVTQELSAIVDGAIDSSNLKEGDNQSDSSNELDSLLPSQEAIKTETIITSVSRDGFPSPHELLSNEEILASDELSSLVDELDEESYSYESIDLISLILLDYSLREHFLLIQAFHMDISNESFYLPSVNPNQSIHWCWILMKHWFIV